jgi:hypothetical protein
MRATRIVFLLVHICLTQVAWAQLMEADFSHNCFTDDFTESTKGWEQNSNMDKLYLIQNGQYLVHRKANRSDVIPVPDFISSSALEMRVSIAFERHTNKMQSAGMVCMVSAGGFYVLEINEKKQYRMWVKANNEQLLLTDGDKLGWKKSEALFQGKLANGILLRVDSGRFDVFFNSVYETSFEDTTLLKGKPGMYVAEDTHVLFDEVSINCKPIPIKAVKPEPVQVPLTKEQKLTELEKQVEQLQKELQKCREQKP